MLAGTASYPVSKLASQRVFEYLQAEKPDWDVFTEHPGVIETNMNSKSGIVLPFDKSKLLLLKLLSSSRHSVSITVLVNANQ